MICCTYNTEITNVALGNLQKNLISVYFCEFFMKKKKLLLNMCLQ